MKLVKLCFAIIAAAAWLTSCGPTLDGGIGGTGVQFGQVDKRN